MLGGALVDALRARGAKNLLLRTRQELDLRDQGATDAFFAQEKPDYAFLSAAKTGGIAVNISQPAQFLHENVPQLIAANTIHSAHRYGVKKLIFIGSASAYPQHTLQPMREEQLFMGHLEPSLAPYAMGKIIGLKLCESYRDQHNCNFIAVNPPNLYGKVSDADLDSASVLPALLTKMHEAKLKKVPAVEIWGTGKPKREFMHVEDMARACILLMERYDAVPEQVPSFINVGVGEDLSIGCRTVLRRLTGRSEKSYETAITMAREVLHFCCCISF